MLISRRPQETRKPSLPPPPLLGLGVAGIEGREEGREERSERLFAETVRNV